MQHMLPKHTHILWIAVFILFTACKAKKNKRTTPVPEEVTQPTTEATQQPQKLQSPPESQDELSQLKYKLLHAMEEQSGPVDGWPDLPVTHRASLNSGWVTTKQAREAKTHYVAWYILPVDSAEFKDPEQRLIREMRHTCLYLTNNPPMPDEFRSWGIAADQLAQTLKEVSQQWEDVYLIQTLDKKAFIHVRNAEQQVGLLDLQGKEAIPARYAYIAALGYVLVAQEEDAFGLMEPNGNWIHQPFTTSFPTEAPLRFYLKNGTLLRK